MAPTQARARAPLMESQHPGIAGRSATPIRTPASVPRSNYVQAPITRSAADAKPSNYAGPARVIQARSDMVMPASSQAAAVPVPAAVPVRTTAQLLSLRNSREEMMNNGLVREAAGDRRVAEGYSSAAAAPPARQRARTPQAVTRSVSPVRGISPPRGGTINLSVPMAASAKLSASMSNEASPSNHSRHLRRVPSLDMFVPARAPRSQEELQRFRQEHCQRAAQRPVDVPREATSYQPESPGDMNPQAVKELLRRNRALEQQLQEAAQQYTVTAQEAVQVAERLEQQLAASKSQEAAAVQRNHELLALVEEAAGSKELAVREAVQNATVLLQHKLAEEAARCQQLQAQIEDLEQRLSSQGVQAGQDYAVEFSRQQSMISELENQLSQAISLQSAAESKSAAEAVAVAVLRQELAGAEMQAAAGGSQSGQLQAALEVSMRAQEELTRSLNEEAATCRNLQAQLGAQKGARELSPSSPSWPPREVEDLRSRCMDLEAQLLDVPLMKDKLSAKEALIADLQRQVASTREERSRPAIDASTMQLPDGVASWLSTMHASESSSSRKLSTNTREELFEAAQKDDVEGLKALFAQHKDPVALVINTVNEKAQTLLHVALASGAPEIARFLLEQGARWAMQRKYHYELMGELLDRETCNFVNHVDSSGSSPMACLCQQSEAPSEEIVMMLMQSQADPMQRDNTGRTPFLECARSGNTDMMKMLLEITRGAVMLDTDDEHRSAMHWAASCGRKDALELLLKVRGDVDSFDASGDTPVDAARRAGKEDIVKLLSDDGKDGQRGSEDRDAEEAYTAAMNGDDKDGEPAGSSLERPNGSAKHEAPLKRAQEQGMLRPTMPQGDDDWPSEEPEIPAER